ncbi:MAG: hypothetical protein CFE43_11880 [Burkholderiales bacterium PBB3]|nr:MAG: hypothetical protein CFE43_11880 [Burkholderiales bacterium PBB3]
MNVRGALAVAGLALATVVLSGCATSRNIDSEVRSFGGATPIAAGATYRFERLPSMAQSPTQDALETATAKVLAGKGLVRNDSNARYTVQVRLDVDRVALDRYPFGAGALLSDRVVLASDGSLWQRVRRPLIDPVAYRHAAHIVVRDIAAGSAVFETQAVQEGPWSDTPNLLEPIVEAALRDYPQAAPTPKTITVVLPAASPGK